MTILRLLGLVLLAVSLPPVYLLAVPWPPDQPTPSVAEKPGSCPVPKENPGGKCPDKCSADQDCVGDKKCCFNGCGLTCQDPDFCATVKCAAPNCSHPIKPQGQCCELCPNDACADVNCSRPQCQQPYKPDGECCPECQITECTKVLCILEGPTCRNLYIPKGQCCPVCPEEKPGECPEIEKHEGGICFQECTFDHDCLGSKKCCSNAYGNTCQVPVKPGKCPIPQKDQVGFCYEECSEDLDCPGNTKCCSNGCGQICQAPDKPGKCPAKVTGNCSDEEKCSWDQDCPGHEKCCSNECGNTCQNPECTNGQNGICNGIQGLSCTNGTTCMFTPKGVADGAGKCCYDNSNAIEICTLPIQPGGDGNVSCEAYIPSYGFNPNSCNCEKFIYSGCGGNENRFGSLEDCRTLCQNVAGCNTTAVCGLPGDPGPCEAEVQRYYYNNETCQCEAFTWGGCDGNQNNFLSFEECSSVCDGSSACEKVEPNCVLPKDPGPCKDFEDRYYFDLFECKCKKFKYGGCGGNMNRFLTKKDCTRSCDWYACI